MRHFLSDETDCFFDDAFEKGITGNLPSVKIDASEQGVIVEHFFKMRNAPAIVCAVTRKAAADNIVHAAARHRLKRVFDKFDIVALLFHNRMMQEEI